MLKNFKIIKFSLIINILKLNKIISLKKKFFNFFYIILSKNLNL